MTNPYIPTTVDLNAIMHRCPRHATCDLVIRASKKNPLFIGLYCVPHGTQLYWLNSYQIGFLTDLGVPNESGMRGLRWNERTQGRLLNPTREIRDNDKPKYQGFYIQDGQRIQDRWDY